MHFQGKSIPCNLCASENHSRVANEDKHGEPLVTVLCNNCGLVFTNPMPTSDEVLAFYRVAYRQQYKGTFTPRRKHVYRSGIRAIPRYERLQDIVRQATRLLDVGSGGGEFLYLMTQLGHVGKGIEPNQGYAEFSIKEYGLDVCATPFEEANFLSGSFDIITAHHVVEHLSDPSLAFAQFHNWLSDTGCLVVEVPNIEANYHSPRTRFHFAHLYNFAEECLGWLGEKAGFRVLDKQLVPGTRHINILFAKDQPRAPQYDDRVAKRVLRSLSDHTRLQHMLSRHPYQRVVQNLSRPLMEKFAIGTPRSSRALLDTTFAKVVSGENIRDTVMASKD